LEPRASIALKAPDSLAWIEAYEFEIAPIWHADYEGLPGVYQASTSKGAREFRLWPGEKLNVRLRRPEGAKGQLMTVDSSALV
jgi:hypothetical protein